MIPRILHQIWLGPGRLPKEWSDQWRAMHPGWEYWLWDERTLPRMQPAFALYMEAADWPGAADVARVEVLARYGGVYADIDSECLRSFARAPFMAAGFFAGYSLPVRNRPGRVANGVMGGVCRHPVLTDYRASIARLNRYRPAWDTVGGTLLTAVVDRHRTADVLILPAGTFYPEGRRGVRADDGAVAYTRHFWSSSPRPIAAYP